MQSFLFALAGGRLHWVQFIIIQFIIIHYTLGTLYKQRQQGKKRGNASSCESSLLHQGSCCPTTTSWERRGHFAASNALILAAPNWKGLFVHFPYIVFSHLGAVFCRLLQPFGALLCSFRGGIYLNCRHSCSQSGHRLHSLLCIWESTYMKITNMRSTAI